MFCVQSVSSLPVKVHVCKRVSHLDGRHIQRLDWVFEAHVRAHCPEAAEVMGPNQHSGRLAHGFLIQLSEKQHISFQMQQTEKSPPDLLLQVSVTPPSTWESLGWAARSNSSVRLKHGVFSGRLVPVFKWTYIILTLWRTRPREGAWACRPALHLRERGSSDSPQLHGALTA